MTPVPAVVLAIDPGAESGAAVMLLGKLVCSVAVADKPEARAFAVGLATGTAERTGLPLLVVIEKFGAGAGARGTFGARTLAGIERRVGAWVEASKVAGVPQRHITRVLPQTWRSRVLGKGGGPSETLKALARVYASRRFTIVATSDDEYEAICIAVWATTAPEVAKMLGKREYARAAARLDEKRSSTVPAGRTPT